MLFAPAPEHCVNYSDKAVQLCHSITAECVTWPTRRSAPVLGRSKVRTGSTLGLSVSLRYADVAAAEDGLAPVLSFIPPSYQYNGQAVRSV